jgi:serine O-acetyltransferase
MTTQRVLPSNPVASRVLLWIARRRWSKLLRLANIILGCDFYAQPPQSVRMPHPNGVVVHSRVRIGMRVTIMHQVTLGEKALSGDGGFPTIEDDVFIGAGAKILGGVNIGRGAVIGANAVVTRDIPAGRTVVGFNRLLEASGTHGEGG